MIKKPSQLFSTAPEKTLQKKLRALVSSGKKMKIKLLTAFGKG